MAKVICMRGVARLAALAVATVLPGTPRLEAQGSKPAEYQVKAAYLYNFGRFVAWPSKIAPSRGESFAVCVLGADPFGPALDATVTGETIHGAKVVARRISTPQDALTCSVLFISLSEDNRLRLTEILAVLDRASVLTVSDLPEFAQRGGMVQFLLDGNRVRFEVNVPAAERAGLNLSSELLKLAVRVKRGP